MADIDCGDCDCGDCDCCCGDCDCGDCDCGCGDCDCSGYTNVIICCCFLPPGDGNNIRRPNRGASAHTDISIFCCCCSSPRRRNTANSTARLRKKPQKGLRSRIWASCCGSSSVPSPPSSPPRVLPKTEYPLDESQLQYPPLNNSERTGKQARWEEQNMTHKDNKMHGKWSRPVQYGDLYNTQHKS